MIVLIGFTAFILLTYFIIVSWVIFGFSKSSQHKNQDINNNQKISVIIPVRNEEKDISKCLNSIIAQNYDNSNFEIIVVNDHSTDETVRIVKGIIAENKANIRLINLEQTNSKKEALKLGVKKSSYPIIATTDGDCVLPQKWLINISRNLNGKQSMLLGPVMFFKQKGFLSAFQTLDFAAIQGFTFGSAFYNNSILNNAANLAYTKLDLNLVEGYDDFKTPSGDDIFLLEKFKSQNLKISSLLTKDFIVETKSENTFKSFIHQRLRWASKSSFYTDRFLLFVSGLIFISNVIVFFDYFFIFFDTKFRLLTIFLLLTKWLIDFILLFLVTSFFERRKVLIYFIPVQLIYPFYILFIGLLSKFYQFEWKGRKINE